jgi:hypothetical protein
MATIDTKKSFLQKFSDKSMNTIRSNRGVSVNLPNKKYTILDRYPNTQTQKTLMDKPFSPKDLFMVKQFEEASKKYGSTKFPSTQTNATTGIPITTTTGFPFPSVVRPTTTVASTVNPTVAPTVNPTVATTVAPTVDPKAGGKPVDVENEIEYLKGIFNNPDSTAESKAFAVKEGERLYGTDITEKTTDQLNQEAINAQNAFITKGVESNVQGLSDAQANALRIIEGQRAGIAPQFQNLRSQASTTSMQQARNFAEYMGARGASMGGTSAQAEIQRGAQLQGQFGQIGLAEQGAIQGLEDKKTEVTLDFESRISQAKTQGEAEKEKFKLQQILENIEDIKAEAKQKTQNAQEIEKQKLKEASETSKSLLEYQRKEAIIKLETAEQIKRDTAQAQLKANQATVDFERKPTTIPKEIPFKQRQEYIDAIIGLEDTYLTSSSKEGKNMLEEKYLDDKGRLNKAGVELIESVRLEFGLQAGDDYGRRLKEFLAI